MAENIKELCLLELGTYNLLRVIASSGCQVLSLFPIPSSFDPIVLEMGLGQSPLVSFALRWHLLQWRNSTVGSLATLQYCILVPL